MCVYFLLTTLCNHSPTLLAGPSCRRIQEELARIHGASAWDTPEALNSVPFAWPDECLPSSDNVRVVSSSRWCGWECRNTYDAGGVRERLASGEEGGAECPRSSEGMGVPGANYGVPRTGIGWREG
ncbi:hypothetical protein F4778DRAFT_182004 [Xylariomycetidae sp. FL2044]|nr:hypothetical protein F4778DRAFT_182004 [Xylariomycetidae sp. FL2044]